MHTLTLNENERTCLLVSLRKREAALLEEDEESMGDSLGDLLLVQHLIKRLEATHSPEQP